MLGGLSNFFNQGFYLDQEAVFLHNNRSCTVIAYYIENNSWPQLLLLWYLLDGQFHIGSVGDN